MFIVQKHNYPYWWLRLRLAFRAGISTWNHLDGVQLMAGDTLNIHHRFEIVSRKVRIHDTTR